MYNPKYFCRRNVSSESHNQDESSINNKQQKGNIPKPRFHNLRVFHNLLLEISPISALLDWGDSIIEKKKHRIQGNN